MKRFLPRTIGFLAVAYGGAAGYMRVNEKSFVFHPAGREVPPPPASLGLDVRERRIPTADGGTLGAWIIPAAPDDSTGMWVLGCHGNLGSIGFGDRPLYYAYTKQAGVNQLVFDYRGFGTSTGVPSEANAYADATAAYQYLRDSLHVDPARIVIFGHSLGSGVAIDLASRVPSAGLIVEGAFTSVVARGQEIYPWLPVTFIATQRFESIRKIGRVSVPTLFLHSPEDDVIPFAHGEALYAAATGAKEFVRVRGGHENAFKIDSLTYFGAMRALVESVTPR